MANFRTMIPSFTMAVPDKVMVAPREVMMPDFPVLPTRQRKLPLAITAPTAFSPPSMPVRETRPAKDAGGPMPDYVTGRLLQREKVAPRQVKTLPVLAMPNTVERLVPAAATPGCGPTQPQEINVTTVNPQFEKPPRRTSITEVPCKGGLPAGVGPPYFDRRNGAMVARSGGLNGLSGLGYYGRAGDEWDQWCNTAADLWAEKRSPTEAERHRQKCVDYNKNNCGGFCVPGDAPWTDVGHGSRGLPLLPVKFSSSAAEMDKGIRALLPRGGGDSSPPVTPDIQPGSDTYHPPGSDTPATSGLSTGLIVGGVAAVGLLGFMLLRKRSGLSGIFSVRAHWRRTKPRGKYKAAKPWSRSWPSSVLATRWGI